MKLTNEKKVELAVEVIRNLHVQPSMVAWSGVGSGHLANTRSADEEKAYSAALKIIAAALR